MSEKPAYLFSFKWKIKQKQKILFFQGRNSNPINTDLLLDSEKRTTKHFIHQVNNEWLKLLSTTKLKGKDKIGILEIWIRNSALQTLLKVILKELYKRQLIFVPDFQQQNRSTLLFLKKLNDRGNESDFVLFDFNLNNDK